MMISPHGLIKFGHKVPMVSRRLHFGWTWDVRIVHIGSWLITQPYNDITSWAHQNWGRKIVDEIARATFWWGKGTHKWFMTSHSNQCQQSREGRILMRQWTCEQLIWARSQVHIHMTILPYGLIQFSRADYRWLSQRLLCSSHQMRMPVSRIWTH